MGREMICIDSVGFESIQIVLIQKQKRYDEFLGVPTFKTAGFNMMEIIFL